MNELNLNCYDIIIIGAGVAGITAGIYAKRAGRKVVIVERMAIGGQLNFVGKIANYTGFAQTDGPSLVSRLYEQVESGGLEIIYDEVISYNLKGEEKIVQCKNKTLQAKAVILALGSNPKELEVSGEKEFRGRGVSYCVQCDGNFFKNKITAVIGSNQSAINGAIYLSKLCAKVYLLAQYDIKNLSLEHIKECENVEIIEDVKVNKIIGKESVDSLEFQKGDKVESLSIDGVFVVAGNRPNTATLNGLIDLTEEGFIICDENMMTSEEGVFACGDVRKSKLKQIATAVGDGAVAGVEASSYVLKKGV